MSFATDVPPIRGRRGLRESSGSDSFLPFPILFFIFFILVWVILLRSLFWSRALHALCATILSVLAIAWQSKCNGRDALAFARALRIGLPQHLSELPSTFVNRCGILGRLCK
jgi:hypothetical protein